MPARFEVDRHDRALALHGDQHHARLKLKHFVALVDVSLRKERDRLAVPQAFGDTAEGPNAEIVGVDRDQTACRTKERSCLGLNKRLMTDKIQPAVPQHVHHAGRVDKAGVVGDHQHAAAQALFCLLGGIADLRAQPDKSRQRTRYAYQIHQQTAKRKQLSFLLNAHGTASPNRLFFLSAAAKSAPDSPFRTGARPPARVHRRACRSRRARVPC